MHPALATDSSVVTKLLSNYCEKTWCNEVSIEFRTFHCDFVKSNRCTLDFTIAEKNEVSCTFHNYNSIEQLIENEEELSERFLEEVTDCVTTKL